MGNDRACGEVIKNETYVFKEIFFDKKMLKLSKIKLKIILNAGLNNLLS